MRFYQQWIERAFRVEHRPGIARSYWRVEPDGTIIMLTDEGGFDLPSRDGPFLAIHMDRDNNVLCGPECLPTRLSLAVWLRPRSTCPIPTDPRI
ncbi:hypothetical protein [Rhodopirellula sp. MGV]|uniref:hypothetical protein n=1 Tax=Rhodopirellula sp. MGV TaxID=2023130 RepID=UPI000B97854B|nr:hypothetical protein [Rhodopirellula sp. MGV]OYP34224.1 hypothetical protein CGZ80_15680 [Rhodopirellula sp. MGV]PNY35032.1 hypothetical protein C2E31_20180 [Rhodopirellula baltica]